MTNCTRNDRGLRITLPKEVLLVVVLWGLHAESMAGAEDGQRIRVTVTSSRDGAEQACYVILPKGLSPPWWNPQPR